MDLTTHALVPNPGVNGPLLTTFRPDYYAVPRSYHTNDYPCYRVSLVWIGLRDPLPLKQLLLSFPKLPTIYPPKDGYVELCPDKSSNGAVEGPSIRRPSHSSRQMCRNLEIWCNNWQESRRRHLRVVRLAIIVLLAWTILVVVVWCPCFDPTQLDHFAMALSIWPHLLTLRNLCFGLDLTILRIIPRHLPSMIHHLGPCFNLIWIKVFVVLLTKTLELWTNTIV